MRQLFPPLKGSRETSVQAVYGDLADRRDDAPADRPHVVLNMVSSADGAITLDGLSGGLSGSADKDVFFYLRSLADVILVGAATARAENYGQPRLSAPLLAQREARGQPPLPRIAVVTRSMRIDRESRLFAADAAPVGRPFVISPADAPAEQRVAVSEVAEVISAGEGSVDLASALSQLAAGGARIVLCEGGPTLNGQLLSAGLVDQLCITVSPALVGGLGKRISGWEEPQPALPLELLTLAEAGGVLLVRYLVQSVPA